MTAPTTTSSTSKATATGIGATLIGVALQVLGYVSSAQHVAGHGADKTVIWTGAITGLGGIATLAAKHIPLAVLEAKAKRDEDLVEAKIAPYRPLLDQVEGVVKADPGFQKEWATMKASVSDDYENIAKLLARDTGLPENKVRSVASDEMRSMLRLLGWTVPEPPAAASPASADPTPPAPAAPAAVDPATQVPQAPLLGA